jgi:hypothetical protein
LTDNPYTSARTIRISHFPFDVKRVHNGSYVGDKKHRLSGVGCGQMGAYGIVPLVQDNPYTSARRIRITCDKNAIKGILSPNARKSENG